MLDIISAISSLAPILTKMSEAAGKNQDTNTILANNSAAQRPGIVAGNLQNARSADLMTNYSPMKFSWGGPGSVARGGPMPSFVGGPGKESPNVSALEQAVMKDALNQAATNYGIKDPAASSTGDKILGGASDITSILNALSKIKGLGGAASDAAPATGPTAANSVASPFPKLPIAGAPPAADAGGGFSNTDPFWGWQDNPGRPLNGLFPVTPEDPRHD